MGSGCHQSIATVTMHRVERPRGPTISTMSSTSSSSSLDVGQVSSTVCLNMRLFSLYLPFSGDCKCPGKEEMVDSRPEQLKTVLKACPKGEDGASMIEKGKCRKGNELDWPIDIKKLFFQCQPKAVSMKKYLNCHGVNAQNKKFPSSSSAKGMTSSLRSLGSDVRKAASPDAKERTGTV